MMNAQRLPIILSNDVGGAVVFEPMTEIDVSDRA